MVNYYFYEIRKSKTQTLLINLFLYTETACTKMFKISLNQTYSFNINLKLHDNITCN